MYGSTLECAFADKQEKTWANFLYYLTLRTLHYSNGRATVLYLTSIDSQISTKPNMGGSRTPPSQIHHVLPSPPLHQTFIVQESSIHSSSAWPWVDESH